MRGPRVSVCMHCGSESAVPVPAGWIVRLDWYLAAMRRKPPTVVAGFCSDACERVHCEQSAGAGGLNIASALGL